MTEDRTPDTLAQFSASVADLVEAHAPSVLALRSRRSHLSGLAWRPGLVVTADEALPEEGEVTATLPSGDERIAEIVGRDPTTDIVLLRVEGAEPASATFDSASARTGSIALAIGAGHTAQLGVIAHSGPAWRSMRGGEIDTRIELDLKLRREAEGGIVIDAEGRTLGMAVFGPRRRTLVIPSATIDRVAPMLERHGRIPRGFLGLALQPVRSGDGEDAVMVMAVDRDGPAARAGIHQGDVIIGWNGAPPARLGALLRNLGPSSIGQPLPLTLRRGGEVVEVTLTIAERAEG